jgi:hypothetical protein
MKVNWNHIAKDIVIFGYIFLGMTIIFSTFLNMAQKISDNLQANLIPAICAILGILMGLVLYGKINKIRSSLRWEQTIISFIILIGLGGVIYEFFNPLIILIGIGATGLLNIIIPTHTATWSKRIFGENYSRRVLIGIAFATACAFYTLMYILGDTDSFVPWFSGVLILIGVLLVVWHIYGERFKFPFVESNYLPNHEKDERNYISHFIVNLITIIGWNFVFLMLIEYWYYFLGSLMTETTLNAKTIQILQSIVLLVGIVIMILMSYFLRDRLSWVYKLSLGLVIVFFAVLAIYYFQPFGNHPTLNLILFLLALVVLPSFIVGLLQCSPFEFNNKFLNLLQIGFILVDLVFILISNLVMPVVFVHYGNNVMFPTVFLVNCIFFGFAFIFNILRTSTLDEEKIILDGTENTESSVKSLVRDENAPDIDRTGYD